MCTVVIPWFLGFYNGSNMQGNIMYFAMYVSFWQSRVSYYPTPSMYIGTLLFVSALTLQKFSYKPII